MKKYVVEFLKRGMSFCFGGPLVLAIVYGILGLVGAVESLTVGEVVTGIFSSTLLAFIAAGITVVHTVDKLSTFLAALIQGVVLYIDYILLYLFNGWLQSSLKPIMIFTIKTRTLLPIYRMCIYFLLVERGEFLTFYNNWW
mgnify:CR=1 FL=1